MRPYTGNPVTNSPFHPHSENESSGSPRRTSRGEPISLAGTRKSFFVERRRRRDHRRMRFFISGDSDRSHVLYEPNVFSRSRNSCQRFIDYRSHSPVYPVPEKKKLIHTCTYRFECICTYLTVDGLSSTASKIIGADFDKKHVTPDASNQYKLIFLSRQSIEIKMK